MPILYREIDHGLYGKQTKGAQAVGKVNQALGYMREKRKLTFRCSATTAAAIRNPWTPLDLVYLSGRDRRKWMSIGGEYQFSKDLKNEAEYFQTSLEFQLGDPAIEWFRENLYYEKIPPIYGDPAFKRAVQDHNPCCKREGVENEQNVGLTIGIPRAAFLDLLFMTDFFSDETEEEAGPVKTASELREAYKLMKEANIDPEPIVRLMRERKIEV